MGELAKKAAAIERQQIENARKAQRLAALAQAGNFSRDQARHIGQGLDQALLLAMPHEHECDPSQR